MNALELLKKALQDPLLEIEVLIPEAYPKVASVLARLPEIACVSEWFHTLGTARYEYHVHAGEFAAELMRAYADGARAGNPKLVHVYSKQDLELLVREQTE